MRTGARVKEERAMAQTGGWDFYNRYHGAIEQRDYRALASFYRSDALHVAVEARQVLHGREAILADLARSCDAAAGPPRPVSIESFVEYGEALGVESTVATRYGQSQVYEVYVFQGGLISHQVSGQITQRRPAAAQAFPNTDAGRYYHGYSAALAALDYGRLRTYYRPGSVRIGLSLGEVRQGQDAILGVFQEQARWGGGLGIKALLAFVEAADVVCCEYVMSRKISPRPMTTGAVDLLGADIAIVQGGAILYQFGCLIQPRPEELKALAIDYELRVHSSKMALYRAMGRAGDRLTGGPPTRFVYRPRG
jgi:hypothetical protein